MLAESMRRLSFSFPATEKVPTTSPTQQVADDCSSESSIRLGSGNTRTDIDVDLINKSLDHVNNYSKRRLTDKLPPVLMYEITSTGESCYKSLTLRELLNDVNDEATSVDESALLELLSGMNNIPNMSRPSEGQEERKTEQEKPIKRQSIILPNLSAAENAAQHRRGVSLTQGITATKSIYESRYNPNAAVDRGEPHLNYSPDGDSVTYDATGALRLRDLRRLDFQFNPNEERSVLIRRHAVLFAMDPIRAVVMANRLILIVPDGADSLLSILDQYMKEWVSAKAASSSNTATTPGTRTEHLNRHPNQHFHQNSDQEFQQSPPDNDDNVTMSTLAASGNSTTSLTGLATGEGGNTKSAGIGKLLRKMSVAKVGKDGSGADKDKQFQQQRLRTEYEKKQFNNASNNSQDLPFEMHAFEALLTTVMALETQEFNRVNGQVQIILNYFRSGSLLPIEVQEKMRNRKNDLSVMIRRITSARNTINELTEDDEDMALMNLSVLRHKPALYHFPLVPEILSKHDEMEELLESYLIDFNALESKIDLTRNQIQNAEELLSLRLDTSRNELLIANTILAILSCCFGLGAYVSGIFGMNLDNTGKLQRTENVFYIVIATSFFGMMLMFLGMVVLFRSNGMFPAKINLLGKDALKLKQ